MGKKSKKAQGIEAFNQFYGETWRTRWPALKEALLAPKVYAAIDPTQNLNLSSDKEIVPGVFILDSGSEVANYCLDPASALAVEQLDVRPGMRVLDLCAAPGGKSLIILNRLKTSGELVANDRSRDRRERLKKNLQHFFNSDSEVKIDVTGHDSSSWCLHEKDAYDRVLLDAPCSSERHVLESPEHLKEWGKGRTERLAKDQFTMLASALDVVKVGGRIIYSTCSISPLENEEVIKKLLKKRADRVSIVQSQDKFSEKSEFGNYLLPDVTNFGPIFFSIIERIS